LSHIESRLASGGPVPDLFALVPGRCPGAVPLADVLKGAATTPEGQAAVKKVIAQFEATTGVTVPPALAAAAVANPARLSNIMQLTPAQMSAGFDAVNARARAGSGTPAAAPKHQLPVAVDLGELDTLPVTRPDSDLKEIAPGLSRGDLKSSLPDAQAKANIVLAETLDRLAGNAQCAPDQQFSVRYRGHAYTKLPNFLAALERAGHKVDVEVSHRVANFAALHATAPDGTLLDVPAPLMVRTGVKDAQGREAVVPAVHSELVIRVTPGPDAKEPRLEAACKWYQGVSATGFFPVDLFETPAWAGAAVPDRFSGKEALKAVRMAGILSDVINHAARDQALQASGYGITGVCNDSVAIIQHALTGRVTGYPLLMRDETLAPEIAKRLGDQARWDDADLRAIRRSIAAVPSDVQANATSGARALASIPWEEGKEPLAAAVAARGILSAAPPDTVTPR
jgi:hypothetical protein